MKTTLSILVLCAAIISFSSCAVNQTIQYNNLVGRIDYTGTQSVAIATLDKREQIRDGKHKPTLVGYMRSGASIAYPVNTLSDKPFSDDFSSSFAASLADRGFQTKVVSTLPAETEDQVVTKLTATSNKRLLLILMRSWQTDGYGAQTLLYDLTITIYDESGKQLISKSFNELNKPLGGSAWGGPGKYKVYIPEAVKFEIAKILSTPEIKDALTSN